MRITLDHNCIIHLANRTEIGMRVKEIVSDKSNQCFMAGISASDQGKKKVRYGRKKFEKRLESCGIAHLSRLPYVFMWDMTDKGWGQSGWATKETIKLVAEIEKVMFSRSKVIEIASEKKKDSPEWKAEIKKKRKNFVNRQCDIHGMLAHIQSGNEIFLTTDSDFLKDTVKAKLQDLGAGRICKPSEMI
jgi:hypothetical protein